MSFTIGLTGGIASGKSYASDIFKKLGAYIIDTDIISREISKVGGLAYSELKENFAEVFEEDILNRRKLRDIVFNSIEKLNKLNSIMHTKIIDEVNKEVAKCPNPIAVVVAPLLFELELQNMFDLTVTIESDKNKRIERIIKRDNTDRSNAIKIINSQMSDSNRKKLADICLMNNSLLEDLDCRIAKVYNIALESLSVLKNQSF